jgi:hypothetical protein
MTIQGRVISTNTNLHLSPAGNTRVIVNSTYRAAGGSDATPAHMSVQGVLMTGAMAINTVPTHHWGPGTGADNQTHSVVCSDGGAMMNLSIYATSRFDGFINFNCMPLPGLLNHADEYWSAASGTADNVTHVSDCDAGYVATGFRVYASGQLDNNMQMRCTHVINANTTAAVTASVSIPWNIGADNTMHTTVCPAGTYVRGVSVYVSSHLDGQMQARCVGLF